MYPFLLPSQLPLLHLYPNLLNIRGDVQRHIVDVMMLQELFVRKKHLGNHPFGSMLDGGPQLTKKAFPRANKDHPGLFFRG